MDLNEVIITQAIAEKFFAKLKRHLDNDVAIVGGGPSGLVAGYFLAKAGRKVALFERKLSVGGGMWGGGMMFNEIVVQKDAVRVLEEFGVRCSLYRENYYTADSIETVSSLIAQAVKAGLTIFNCMTVEDVMMRSEKITGLVLNWSPVEMAGLHVDPLAVAAQHVIDATGHATEIVKVVAKKVPGQLQTPSGKIEGEKAMWASRAETLTLENTREVFPGLFVAGMCANATLGGPRMGPIFGGMLLSGEKVAQMILKKSVS